MKSPASWKGKHFLDLFGGKCGVAKAIQKLGFVAYTWDAEIDPRYDLTLPKNVSAIEERIRKGEVSGVILAPCTRQDTCRQDERTSMGAHRAPGT